MGEEADDVGSEGHRAPGELADELRGRRPGRHREERRSLRNIKGAWVSEQKVDVADGKIVAYRVTLRITFVLD